MKNITQTELDDLKGHIESILSNPELLKEKKHQHVVYNVLRKLEQGSLRVCSPEGLGPNCGAVPMENLKTWQTHSWVKETILLAMKLRVAKTAKFDSHHDGDFETWGRVHGGSLSYHDKFDVRSDLAQNQVRSLPGAIAREGCHIAQGVILMPSFVNIGAWVGQGTMIDTWATAGSCAQIGQGVHVAGGVGIGGVLEPANARPVLVGDGAFLGSRVIAVEGAVIGEKSVLAANVCITSSTPIYDVTTPEKTQYRGFVPPYAVVAPGTRTKQFPGGDVSLSCAYIIAYRNEKTDSKVSLNDVLRETGVVV